MARKDSHTSRALEPPEFDDLKLIHGISPAVERRLHGVGIYTFAQLAALSPADIAASVAGLSGLTAESITKQDWIGQAHKLAEDSIPTEPQQVAEIPEVVPPVVSQVELTALAAEKTESIPPVVAEPELAASATEVTEPVPPIVAPLDAKEAEITPPVVATTGPVSVLRLRKIEVVQADAHGLQNFLSHGQPFQVRLTLDLSDVVAPEASQLSYKVSIYCNSLEGHSR